MANIMVTGHGHFATGLASAAKLIIGNISNLHTLDFTEECAPSEFKDVLSSKIAALPDDDILVLSDLIGGTPYKSAVEISCNSTKKIRVIGGVNLPLVIEASLSLVDSESIDSFVEELKNQGKLSIDSFALINDTTPDNDEVL